MSKTDKMFVPNISNLEKQDSIFESVTNNSTEDSAKIQNKKFDYNQEVLDFSKDKANENSKKDIASFQQYDLNTVSLSQLVRLSGIGKKTAENIVNYRNKNGNFKSIEQLLQVKGIGEKKLSELKKFLIIK